MSVLARLRITYDRPMTTLPATVIAKFRSPHPGAARMDAAFGHYERERRFYSELAASSPVKAPRLFHESTDRPNRTFVLLLEDLAPAEVGDQLAGLSPRQAADTIEAIAPLHAHWWRSSALAGLDWLADASGSRDGALLSACQELWPAYVAFGGDGLEPGARQAGARLPGRMASLLDACRGRPQTLIHGDLRADNLLFGAGSPSFVDWQLAARRPGASDVAYLLTSSLTPAVRRASERSLIERYHRALVSHGVEDYPLAECLSDYRLGALLGWCWPIVGVGLLDLADARAAAMFRAWSERMSAAVADLDLASLLA